MSASKSSGSCLYPVGRYLSQFGLLTMETQLETCESQMRASWFKRRWSVLRCLSRSIGRLCGFLKELQPQPKSVGSWHFGDFFL